MFFPDAVVNIKGQAWQQNQKIIVLRLTIKDLLEAGAHFGHQTSRWNPKMKRFIFEERNGLYIIDLAKTLQQIRNAVEIVRVILLRGTNLSSLWEQKNRRKVVVREFS